MARDRSPSFIPEDVDETEPANGVAPWRDPQWLAEADGWISESCDAAGVQRTGPGRLRGRLWSVVARVPTTGGDLWFKQNAPRGGFEPALLAFLAARDPEAASALVAIDARRYRSLTRDVGDRLDDLLKRDPDMRHLHAPLRHYAELQRHLAAHVDELLALGVPDGRPAHIEALLDDVLAAAPSGILDEDVRRHVAAKLPELRADAAELEALAVPATIDHQDLHPGNMLGRNSGDSSHGNSGGDSSSGSRAFDWGDASLGSPFGSILVVLRALPDFAPTDRTDPEVLRLREVYLEAWRQDGRWTTAELDRAVVLALRLTMVMRAHTWTRVLPCFRSNARPWRQVAEWLGRIGCEDPVTVGL